jgi:hypothetical protein
LEVISNGEITEQNLIHVDPVVLELKYADRRRDGRDQTIMSSFRALRGKKA